MKQRRHKINFKNNYYSTYHLRTKVDTIDNSMRTLGFETLGVCEEFVNGADVIQFTEESDRDYLTIFNVKYLLSGNTYQNITFHNIRYQDYTSYSRSMNKPGNEMCAVYDFCRLKDDGNFYMTNINFPEVPSTIQPIFKI